MKFFGLPFFPKKGIFLKDLISKKKSDIAFSLKRAFYAFFNRPIAKTDIWVTVTQRGQEPRKIVLGSNVVVDSASILLARLVKDSSEPAGGITYLALGTGGIGWDLLNPPAADPEQEGLETEIFRVTPSASRFIDSGSGLESLVPTNIVDFDFHIAEAEAVGALMELGLFGGDATITSGSGTPVTYKTFGVISKNSEMTLDFTYRLTF